MHKRVTILAGFVCLMTNIMGQPAQSRLSAAFAKLEKDSQLTHGIAAFYVADAETGATVFDRNGNLGLAPASAQKVVTAAAALDMLGKGFRYRTVFGYADTVVSGVLHGTLVVKGSGDPTLGSDRYPQTRPTELGKALRKSLAELGIRAAEGGITGILPDQESLTIPRGWIWEDIANYYGAGHGSLNWQENQFDLWLRPGGRVGEGVQILGNRGQGIGNREQRALYKSDTIPSPRFRGDTYALFPMPLINELTTGSKNSGDNAYLFFNPGTGGYTLRGTIPCCVDSFRIAGAVNYPDQWALEEIARLGGIAGPARLRRTHGQGDAFPYKPLYVHSSPGLDSIVYWFLRKSINLYGEALVHTISKQKTGTASYEVGLQQLRRFWKEKGIDSAALNIVDGSGLSPQNRVTARALTQVMLYARKRAWYPAFYEALPIYNGMNMKSGTIGGVKSYTGYVKGKNGREYAFAIIVNNYAGSASAINKKMYAVLDALKN
jgi:D-alanyl-D-alanine carboxypeptidase/D-alanyl-D-alanine-endopeptidase (penicillin-binding protein 4)